MSTDDAMVIILLFASSTKGKSAVESGNVASPDKVRVTFAKFNAERSPTDVTAANPVPVRAILLPELLNAVA